MLEVQNLSVTARNGAQLLKQISFQIETGEAVGLTGQSGAGKTTLLKALLGILSGGCQVSGGTIQVESKINEGTRYTIVLPFKVDHHPKIDDDPKEHLSLKGKKALLAEDNNLNMEIARFQLEQEEIEVFTASNGKEAVEMFEASQPGFYDIILMDIMMPVMDGLTATRTIRALDRQDAKTIPIIAMTANAFREDAEKCMEAGMNAHLAKPLDDEKIKQTISEELRKQNACHE